MKSISPYKVGEWILFLIEVREWVLFLIEVTNVALPSLHSVLMVDVGYGLVIGF